MKKIITTVGTSLITNGQKQNDGFISYRDVNILEGRRHNESIKPELKSRIEQLSKKIQKNLKFQYASFAAETASLLKIAEELKEPFEVYLLATDTILSPVCAEMIKIWFEIQKLNSELQNIELFNTIHFESNTRYIILGLQVKNKDVFEREGMPALVERVNDLTNTYDTVFNITGGYKAIIPYMTIIGQIYQVPIYYTFKGDSSDDDFELIKIPQAPFDINWSMFEKYRKTIEELYNGVEDWTSHRIKNNIGDDFSLCVYHDNNDDTAFLSGIGQLFHEKYNRWLMVKVLANGPFSQKEADKNRKVLNQAIEGLYNMLNDFIKNNKASWSIVDKENLIHALLTSGGDLLNHANKGNKNYFICKYPKSSPEIRLLYSFDIENETLAGLKVYHFKVGGFDHDKYVSEFHDFYKNNINKDFIPYLQVIKN